MPSSYTNCSTPSVAAAAAVTEELTSSAAPHPPHAEGDGQRGDGAVKQLPAGVVPPHQYHRRARAERVQRQPAGDRAGLQNNTDTTEGIRAQS